MPEIPENITTSWLFADDLKSADENIFEFVELKLNYKTRKGKELPVFILLGETKERLGEFVAASWNLNTKAVEEKLGKNTDTWGTPKLNLIPEYKEGKHTGKIIVKVVE